MSKFEKLLWRVRKLDRDLRFSELQKVLEWYGYTISNIGNGSSYYVFRKKGSTPITIPKHKPVKLIYIRLVKQVIEGAE